MSRTTSLRIVKLGGSLLSLDDLSDRLGAWLEMQPPMQTGIIVGGGGVVDAMRELDKRFGLDSAAMHWRCVKMLEYTTDIVAELMPDWDRITDSKGLGDWLSHPTVATAWIDTAAFYDECSLADLPKDWRTTTDALAALLATKCSASELVLLKSCSLPDGVDWNEAASRQIVDEAFSQFAAEVPHVRVVNLKAFN